MNDFKLVDFGMCRECVHWNKPESEDPCCDCLEIPARTSSSIPECFKRGRKRSVQNVKKRRRKKHDRHDRKRFNK